MWKKKQAQSADAEQALYDEVVRRIEHGEGNSRIAYEMGIPVEDVIDISRVLYAPKPEPAPTQHYSPVNWRDAPELGWPQARRRRYDREVF